MFDLNKMETLPKIMIEIIQNLDQIDLKREEVMKLTRKLNRLSGRGIAKVVMNQECEDNLSESRDIMIQVASHMKTLAPITSWKVTISGVEEYVEFELLYALIHGIEIPTANLLQVPEWLWLTALADVPGELRRVILNKLIAGDTQKAGELLRSLQEIYNLMTGLEFSKTLISNLRKKIDIIRAVTERTESDFAHAIIAEKNRSN
jgi:translin